MLFRHPAFCDVCGKGRTRKAGFGNRLLIEEVGGAQANDLPAFGDSFQVKAHLGAATLLGGQDIGRLSIHFDVGRGECNIFIPSNLQEMVAKLEAVVEGEESDHLVVKPGIVRHAGRIENPKHAVQVMGLHATLQVG